MRSLPLSVSHTRAVASLEPEASRAIEIAKFVDATDIPPIYFDRAYYLTPGEGALKAYALLLYRYDVPAAKYKRRCPSRIVSTSASRS